MILKILAVVIGVAAVMGFLWSIFDVVYGWIRKKKK